MLFVRASRTLQAIMGSALWRIYGVRVMTWGKLALTQRQRDHLLRANDIESLTNLASRCRPATASLLVLLCYCDEHRRASESRASGSCRAFLCRTYDQWAVPWRVQSMWS